MTTRTPTATSDLAHASGTIVLLRATIRATIRGTIRATVRATIRATTPAITMVLLLLAAGTLLGAFLGYVVVAGLHVAGVDDLDLVGLDSLPLPG